MRPASPTHLALLQAAHAIRRERLETGQGATLRELVVRSQVGLKNARSTVDNLKRAGHLRIVGERRVEYRNRPVKEYAPAKVLSMEDVQAMSGPDALSECMQSWSR